MGAAFRDLVTSEPDVLECYSVTGEYDYQLKIITASTASLEQLLARIKAAVGVSKTSTANYFVHGQAQFPHRAVKRVERACGGGNFPRRGAV